jgi:monoamine oxidase
MNINPKDRRNYHHLSVEQKKVLFTAIHKAVKHFNLSYSRMFTEPRAKGYRTKLWHGDVSIGMVHTIADRIYSELKQSSMASWVSNVEGYKVKTSSGYRRASPCPAFYIKFN